MGLTRSVVETFNVDSGRTNVLLEANFRLQSPTWRPDGQMLYMNGCGRLYGLALGDTSLELICGDATVRIDKDHGISKDGSMMAMTALVRGDGTSRNQAGVFIIRKGWPTPHLVTASGPAWFHGFSPDGAKVIYTCKRNGKFSIATSPVDGGQETLILGGPAGDGKHYDCPEYSSDGGAIWFVSDRAGPVDIWRLRQDSGALERMTEGPEADWFPHPSPDGRSVCFLSYPPGTMGHQIDTVVALRLMPAQGGEAVTVREFYGGNGSMTSPCWSPDGQHITYVRYEPHAKGDAV